jgi:heme-degrading monooxygenase HmoA
VAKARAFHSVDNPNEIVMLVEWDDLTKARNFTQSKELKKVMEKAGVTDKPDIYFLEKIENVTA